MSLVALNVRRERQAILGTPRNLDSEEWAIDDSNIEIAAPSVCKKDGYTDGLVNSRVVIDEAGTKRYLWVTQTVTEILALS